MSAENKCPGNWLQFLKDAINKKGLNKFLAETLSAMTYPSDRQLIVTHRENILSNCGMTTPVCSH